MPRRELRPARRRALGLLAGVPAALAMTSTLSAPETPITRPIPASGERLPVVGVGTWQTFDIGDDAAARARLREVLARFAQGGAKTIDSSPMYGSSESVAGELIAGLGLRERLFLATKVWIHGRAEGVRQMEESFRRLRVARMDLMQIHNLLDAASHTRTLEQWQHEGRVRYIGITHYTASAYAEVERWLKRGRYDFLQINYSLAERDAERRLLPLAQEMKVAVIVNRPFAGADTFRRVRGEPLPSWAREFGIASWAQYFLKWIIAHPAVTCAIPGTANPAHLTDNLAAAYGPLPDAAARARMTQYFDSL